MNTEINGLIARVSLAFALLLDTKLIAFFRNVVAMMTDNPVYTKPEPTLPDVTAKVDLFEQQVQKAADRSTLAIATRNQTRGEVLTLGRQLASFVQGHCGENLPNLISSGFDAVKARTPSVKPEIPANATLKQTGSSGELLFQFKRQRNAVNNTIQIAENANGPWEDRGLSTATRVKLDSLTRGKVYWARACANGAAGSSDYCTPASAMAL
jgi:hypothetical protein